MHEAFWNGLFDTRWEDAPLGREAIRLVLWLRKRGYRERSCRAYAHAVVHLGRYLHEAQADVRSGALDEALLTDFIEHHLPVCRCYHQRPGRRQDHVRWGLAQLLAMLREKGEILPSTSPRPIYDEVLEGYCRFLRHDRGLAETTITNYRRYVRDFLISRGDAVGCRELAQLTTDDLLTFSRQRGAGLRATAWNHLALSVSHFYRWLDLGGHRSQHLVRTVPLRRQYRLAEGAARVIVGPGAAAARRGRPARAQRTTQLRHAPVGGDLRPAELRGPGAASRRHPLVGRRHRDRLSENRPPPDAAAHPLGG